MSVFGFPIAEVEPPGPVDNTQLLQLSSGGEKVNLVEGALFRKLSPATWKYFLHIYGGGPTIVTTMDALQWSILYNCVCVCVCVFLAKPSFLSLYLVCVCVCPRAWYTMSKLLLLLEIELIKISKFMTMIDLWFFFIYMYLTNFFMLAFIKINLTTPIHPGPSSPHLSQWYGINNTFIMTVIFCIMVNYCTYSNITWNYVKIIFEKTILLRWQCYKNRTDMYIHRDLFIAVTSADGSVLKFERMMFYA